jgi:hypothetical protein
VELSYLDWNGDGETMVFSRGGALTAHSWDLVCLGLRDRWRCLALDIARARATAAGHKHNTPGKSSLPGVLSEPKASHLTWLASKPSESSQKIEGA